MNESNTKSRPWQYSLRTLFILTFIVGALCSSCISFRYWYIKWKYPYGWSHCCDKGLLLSLMNYADTHGGQFPTGGSTPEASLSLLYPQSIDAYTLVGKTVNSEIAEKLLQQGKPLGPETCGWHYVDEGLTVKDDPDIALVWDKIGLGHNGERLSEGGHMVIFRNTVRYITEAEWPDFIKQQEALLAKRKNKTLSSPPPSQKQILESGAP